MRKTSFVRLSISVLVLAILGSGAVLHARDHVPAKAGVHKVVFAVERVAPEGLDMVGVVGDVFVDGCTQNEARCSKAWRDLGQLAARTACRRLFRRARRTLTVGRACAH